MATKQEALKVLLATYSKLKQLYTQDPELQVDATEEDKALYEKVGELYMKLQKNTFFDSIDPVLDQLRKTFQEAQNQWEALSKGLDFKALAQLQANENDKLLLETLAGTTIPDFLAAGKVLLKTLVSKRDATYQPEIDALKQLMRTASEQLDDFEIFLKFQKENKLSEKDTQTVVSIMGSLEDTGDALMQRKKYLEALLTKEGASVIGEALLVYDQTDRAITDAARMTTDESAIQKELQEINDQLKCKMDYRKNLLKLVTNQTVRIDYDNALPEGIDGQILYDQECNTCVVQCRYEATEALIAHEMQHLIQVQRGDLALNKDGRGTFGPLYDLMDEIEAYQIQFLVSPKTVVGYPNTIKTYSDLTADAIRNMHAVYTNLPTEQYNIHSPFRKLITHPIAGEALSLALTTAGVLPAGMDNKISDNSTFYDICSIQKI